MKYLVMAFLLVSCSKSVDNSVMAKKTNNVLSSSFLVWVLDSITLSITLEPYVMCYSYKNRETPKPCDIFVYATVNLSKPISACLKIELERKNRNDNSGVTMVIESNTVKSIINTGFSNQDNQNVPDVIRIKKVTVIPVED